MSKKSSTFVANFKTIKRKESSMAVRTISSYTGYGYRVQLIKRTGVEKDYSVQQNRRVLVSTGNEGLAKDVFLNTIAGIVRQTFIKYGEEV